MLAQLADSTTAAPWALANARATSGALRKPVETLSLSAMLDSRCTT